MLSPDAAREGHAVLFFEEEEALFEGVCDFLADGLRLGQPALVITGDDRIRGIRHGLSRRRIAVERLEGSGRLVLRDVREILAGFMDADRPDEDRFDATVGSLVERAHGPVRVYGDMVEVLWREGNRSAAARLEELWNELGHRHVFSLMCGYALDCFPFDDKGAAFERICGLHGHVIPAESYPRWADQDARAREVSRLQQRARALEAEVERRRALEHSLRQAKDDAERANRAKSEFLAVMSHELRTPLNAIIGYTELLVEGFAGPLNSEHDRYLTRIDGGARQLLRLIDQILGFSRVEQGSVDLAFEQVDVADLVRECAALVEVGAASKGLTLEARLPERPLTCLTDPGKLGQVLLNLLSNAIKFTEEGTVGIDVTPSDAEILFTVRDTGDGVAAEDRERIFEPFIQVDGSAARVRGGTGLGLAVSRHLSRLLGGELGVESTPGEGSAFMLRIPRNGSAVAS